MDKYDITRQLIAAIVADHEAGIDIHPAADALLSHMYAAFPAPMMDEESVRADHDQVKQIFGAPDKDILKGRIYQDPSYYRETIFPVIVIKYIIYVCDIALFPAQLSVEVFNTFHERYAHLLVNQKVGRVF